MNRAQFNQTLLLVVFSTLASCLCRASLSAEVCRPNVILVMTDDQSFADFGVNGNEVILTPYIDLLAEQSTSFSQFYVSPVCSATRASLMTGRYNYRTRVVDTWLGRSMLEPSEVTLAESLSKGGYATGIFGKWHLGDCYPMRPTDQGFQEALVHRGGGLAQPSDPLNNRRRYTDPVLIHNGETVQTQGYCTDVYFRAAEQFIDLAVAQEKNFFVYIATNAPHGPYHDVPERLRAQYAAESDRLRRLLPEDSASDDRVVDDLTRVAAMITNIDENVGKLRRFLESRRLNQNTLFLFLCDNGPTPRRFTGKHRGMKCEVLEGGIRSPLWISWPAGIKSNGKLNEIAAHIDLMPTILEACGIEPDANIQLDGRSLMPLIQNADVDWPDREIVIQAHRGGEPQRYHNFMIRNQQWKLVHPSGFDLETFEGTPQFELYDTATDPGEMRNLAELHSELVDRLRAAYDRWFDDVSATRPNNYAPPRIHVGTEFEKETVLTRNDWQGENWSSETVGHWQVRIARGGIYRAVVHFEQLGDEVTIEIGDVHRTVSSNGRMSVAFDEIQLSPGECSVTAWASRPGRWGAYQIFLSRVAESYPTP
ncbi:arylsulfatase [Bythopirellula polymerisocia]|uniref:Arylsulfatase n=1 Tax=Bythopirellula polymerisocia TaxID=2528003 RepID=A0A5C6CCS7_9BACT|nr:arylsulfatase [Bythopirellula polymerisocia]TWU21835.1 Arylsulfatase precursor [Bythopirellula polymerisocia]